MPPKKKPRPPSDEPEAQTLSKRRTTRAHRPPDPVTPKRPSPDPEKSTVPNQDNKRACQPTKRAPAKHLARNASIALSEARALDTPPRAVNSLPTTSTPSTLAGGDAIILSAARAINTEEILDDGDDGGNNNIDNIDDDDNNGDDDDDGDDGDDDGDDRKLPAKKYKGGNDCDDDNNIDGKLPAKKSHARAAKKSVQYTSDSDTADLDDARDPTYRPHPNNDDDSDDYANMSDLDFSDNEDITQKA